MKISKKTQKLLKNLKQVWKNLLCSVKEENDMSELRANVFHVAKYILQKKEL